MNGSALEPFIVLHIIGLKKNSIILNSMLSLMCVWQKIARITFIMFPMFLFFNFQIIISLLIFSKSRYKYTSYIYNIKNPKQILQTSIIVRSSFFKLLYLLCFRYHSMCCFAQESSFLQNSKINVHFLYKIHE